MCEFNFKQGAIMKSLLGNHFKSIQDLKLINSKHLVKTYDNLGVNSYDKPINLLTLRDVHITKFGVYLPNDNCFLYESSLASMLEHKNDNISKILHSSSVFPPVERTWSKKIKNLDESLFLAYPWDINYQHFFIETLPKAFAIKKHIKFTTLSPTIIKINNGFSNDYFKDLGFGTSKSVCLNDINNNEYVYSKVLHISTPINTNMLKVKNSFLKESINHIQSLYNNEDISCEHIFINRKRAKNNNGVSRVMLNSDSVELFLKKQGFENLYMEGLSLSEKIKKLSNTKVAISPVGAGLVNFCFSTKLKKIIIINHEHLNIPPSGLSTYLNVF